MRTVKFARALGILMIFGLPLSACGDGGQATDEETDAASEAAATTEEEAASPAESEQAGDVEEFCNTAVEAIAVVGAYPEVDFETASPEQIDEAIAAFAEQRYAAVCFLPQGTTSLEQLEEEPPPGESPAPDASPPGAPHFTLGMSQEFTVE